MVLEMSRASAAKYSAFFMLPAIFFLHCGGAAPSANAPDPSGRSYNEYLKQGYTPPKNETLSAPTITEADSMVLHFIDVGQGAATLLEFPCGAMLIDTGGEHNALFDSEPKLLAYLNDFFQRRSDLNKTLDALVISHPHIDHTRSIPAVLRNYKVLNIVDNGDVQDDIGGKPQIALHNWLYEKNQKIAERNRARKRNGGRGIRMEAPVGHVDISSEDVGTRGITSSVINPIPACPASDVQPKIQALWGMRLGRSEKGHNANNDSVVLRVDFGKSSALLSGDLELLSIAWMTQHYQDSPEILDTDIYYVPHHGSRNSTGAHWLSLVSPRVAVISMGPYERHLKTWPEFTARSFGHPNKNNVDHLLNLENGVSASRETPVDVMVGRRGAWKETPSEFEPRTIKKAVYATGWDGHVAVTAHANGRLEVESSGRKPSTAVVTLVNEEACKEAIENIRRLSGLGANDVATDPTAAIRSCRNNSNRESVDCIRNAKTVPDLEKCEGDDEAENAHKH